MRWISKRAVLEIHRVQVLEHGGAGQIRDRGLLDSALARPQHLFAYENADIYRLAAAYAFGIIKSHPFVDGNKRVGFVTAAIFLILSGYELTGSEAETATIILDVPSGQTSENELANGSN